MAELTGVFSLTGPTYGQLHERLAAVGARTLKRVSKHTTVVVVPDGELESAKASLLAKWKSQGAPGLTLMDESTAVCLISAPSDSSASAPKAAVVVDMTVEEEEMMVTVLMNQQRRTISITPFMLLDSFKLEIQTRMGVPKECQRLIYAGRELKEGAGSSVVDLTDDGGRTTMHELGLKNNAFVHLQSRQSDNQKVSSSASSSSSNNVQRLAAPPRPAPPRPAPPDEKRLRRIRNR
jgi:hypothetical protein